MSWQTLQVEVPNELKDVLASELSLDGMLGVWEQPSSKPGRVILVFYFEAAQVPPAVEDRLGRIFRRNGHPVPPVTRGTLEKEDWTKQWRKGYTSFSIGSRFQVVPSWETRDRSDFGRIELYVDPGLAFGTGTHETTQLMIESLEKLETKEGPVLDLGAGSGILTIAAAKLGFTVGAACDLDRDATNVASDNLRRNRVSVPLFVGSVDAIRSGSINLVLANLTNDVIQDLVGEIDRILTPAGVALFSGILDTQADAFRAFLARKGFQVHGEIHRGEWVAMKVERHGD